MPRFLRISQIEVGPRQRKEMAAKGIGDLKESIATNGLINPIVVVKLGADPDFVQPTSGPSLLGIKARLVAGGRRLRSITELHDEKVPIRHEQADIPLGCVPVLVLEGKSLASLLSIEYDENVVREELPWQDQVEALTAIHNARKAEAEAIGKTQTKTDTAVEIQKALGGEEKATLTSVRKQVSQALAISALLESRPDIQKAKSVREAYSIVLREGHERFEAELARRKLQRVKPDERLWDLRMGDLRQVLLDLPDGFVDLILVDPPYGVDIHKEKYAASTRHRYEDSEQYARDLCIFIIQEGWRLAKNRSNLFMFCSFESFPILKEAAARYGWTPWYHPIVWQKSVAEGEAPWGRLGFLRTHEFLFWATRDRRGLSGPIPDVLTFNKVGARARVHGAEKPLSLLEFLIEKATVPMDMVLDPCVGSGSTLLAAARKKRRVIGIEFDEIYYNRAMSRMANFEQGKSDDAFDVKGSGEAGAREASEGGEGEVDDSNLGIRSE